VLERFKLAETVKRADLSHVVGPRIGSIFTILGEELHNGPRSG
jgi:hypothetical protein